MSSEHDSAPASKPPDDSGHAESGAVAVERKPVQAKSTARSGHAVEPPPSIRPKSKPKPIVGSAAPVKRVGHGDGESGPSHPKTGASTAGSKRSYRTTRSVPVVVGEQVAKKPANVGAVTGPPRASARAAVSGSAGTGVGAGPGSAASAASTTQTAVKGVDPGTFTQVVAAAAGIEAAGTATVATDAKTKAKGPKRVKLNLSYVAPLSVMKISFLVSVAMGIAFVVAIFILWTVLNDRHIFTQIDAMITEVVGKNRPDALNILQYVEQGRIMSGAAIIAVIDVIVFTIISTLVAVIYNIIAALVGGVRVTLKER